MTGSWAQCRPTAGGLMAAATDVITPLVTDAQGQWTHVITLPPGLPPGTTGYFQIWWMDAGGPEGWASSNALSGTTPF